MGFRAPLLPLGLAATTTQAAGLNAPLPFLGAFAGPSAVNGGFASLFAFWAGGGGASGVTPVLGSFIPTFRRRRR